MGDPAISTNVTHQPPLLLSADDYDRLVELARTAPGRYTMDDAQRLLDELYRADIVPSGWLPRSTVRMNTHVEFRNDNTGSTRRVQLVYPHDADVGRGRISVLSPVGAALLGLSEGQSIGWSAPGGRRRRLTVLRVSDRPFEAVPFA